MANSLNLARVVAAPAEAVWAEMSDFVESSKHMGIRKFVTNANPAVGGTKVGCVRHLLFPGMPTPAKETLTRYSAEKMTWSLTVETHMYVPMIGYDGTVAVTRLDTDGRQSLLTYTGSFKDVVEGSGVTAAEQLKTIEKTYNGFFASIAKVFESAPASSNSRSTAGRLEGKVCLVTGGSSGLGAAMCRAFGTEGAKVVIADMDVQKGEKLQKKIEGSTFLHLNVSKPEEVDKVVAGVVAKYARLDVVVNNAGIIGEWLPTAEYTTANWEKVRSVNMDGAFFVLRAALKQMQSQKPTGGVVLNMVSTSAFSAFPRIAGYIAAKAGLMGLTRSCAAEYGPLGIRVLALAPTGVLTPLVMQVAADINSKETQAPPDRHTNPLPGMPTPVDVANVAVFACSEEAKWVTGCCIPIDGGYLAGNAGFGNDMARGAKL